MKRIETMVAVLALAVAACGGNEHACVELPSEPAAASGADESAPSPSEPDAGAAAIAPTVRDQGTLHFDGTPEVPPELHARLQQYLETRTATVQDISDDGARLLITTRFANTAQAHEVSAPLGDRHQITFGDEPIFGAAYAPDDESAVYVQADVGGNENYQIYRFDRRTGRATRLTDGLHRQPEMLLSRDGSRLAYVSNARNGRDMDLWMSDGHGPGELFLERDGDWHLLDFSRDGRRLLVQQFVSITEQRIYLVDVASRELMPISGEHASARTAIFDATGDHVLYTSDQGTEFVQLFDLRLTDLVRTEPREGMLTALTESIPWNVEDIALSPDGRTLAFTVNEDGVSTLHLLDTRTHRIRAATSDVPRGVITGLRFAREAPVLAFTVVSSALSGDAFTYDVRRNRLDRWTQSEMGGLDPASFVEPTLVHYPTFDGRQIPCFYFRPRGEGPFPVVLSIHGGPEAQARPWFYALLQYLAVEEHVAVLMPNVRGSDGYGRSYLALDDGRRREDSVRDIGALLDWLGTQPELDASRVAVYGGSYGGYMVLASLTHYSDRLRAGIDVVGIANFVTFLENTAPYRRDLRRVEYGDESDPEMRTFLAEISPVTHVDHIGTALFVAHGGNDPRVPAGEAEQIVQAVRGQGHEVWYMLADDEGHGFVRKQTRDRFTELAVLFLERALRPN
jgi:dipeptidyl aminopeptidase/acylaminoacyl peptidase